MPLMVKRQTSEVASQARGVDDEAVAHVAGQHPLVGLVDVIGFDDFDFRGHAVLGAESGVETQPPVVHQAGVLIGVGFSVS